MDGIIGFVGLMVVAGVVISIIKAAWHQSDAYRSQQLREQTKLLREQNELLRNQLNERDSKNGKD